MWWCYVVSLCGVTWWCYGMLGTVQARFFWTVCKAFNLKIVDFVEKLITVTEFELNSCGVTFQI